jgi:hypothetical protein
MMGPIGYTLGVVPHRFWDIAFNVSDSISWKLLIMIPSASRSCWER